MKIAPVELVPVPQMPELYGSQPVQEASTPYLQQRKLIDEEDLLAKTACLLEILADEVTGEYPQLRAARVLLERKQIECELVEVWSRWHDDKGDPEEAAAEFEMLLADQDLRTVYDLNDPSNPLLAYVTHLLAALLGSGKQYPFEGKSKLPAYLNGTLLGDCLDGYASISKAALAFQNGQFQTAASQAETLAGQNMPPWLKLLVYELWADVVLAARQHPNYSGPAALGQLGELSRILDEWVSLWPDEDPIAGARFYETQGQARRAERIHGLLGELAREELLRGDEKKARRILEMFLEQELPTSRRFGAHEPSIQQIWMYLSTPGDKRIRLVLELEHADEAEVEDWIQNEEPYVSRGACPKAVLLAEHSSSKPRGLRYGVDDLHGYLQDELDRTGAHPARVEKFLRAYRQGQIDEQPAEWIWIDVEDTSTLGGMAFAVELAAGADGQVVRWWIHTLVELDPVDPSAARWRKALRMAAGDFADVKRARQQLYDDCVDALARLEGRE